MRTLVLAAMITSAFCAISPLESHAETKRAGIHMNLDAKNFIYEVQLTPSDLMNYRHFGTAIAMSGDKSTLAVGSDNIGSDVLSNQVYIYTRSGRNWIYQQTIKPSDEDGVDKDFGAEISMSHDGSIIVVPAVRDDENYHVTNVGAVYVFERSGGTWTEVQKIRPEYTSQGFFGEGAAISGDGSRIFIGAPRQGGGYRGRIWVYEHDGMSWIPKTSIERPDYVNNGHFGTSVATNYDGSVFVASYPNDEIDGSTRTGSISIVRQDETGWNIEQTIPSPYVQSGLRFGAEALAMSGDGNTIVVGAHLSNAFGTKNGDAFVTTYDGGSWTTLTRLAPPGRGDYDYFGIDASVDHDGSVVVVGSSGHDTTVSASGAAFVYERIAGGWQHTLDFQASDRDVNDAFGSAVTVSADGRKVGIGSYRKNDETAPWGGHTDSGAAYIFDR